MPVSVPVCSESQFGSDSSSQHDPAFMSLASHQSILSMTKFEYYVIFVMILL